MLETFGGIPANFVSVEVKRLRSIVKKIGIDRRPARTTTCERSNDFNRWAFCTCGCIRVVDGETLAGWGVISRSTRERIEVMFGPVVTTEAHLAFSGTRTHSNNSAVMTATIEALSFFVLHGRFGLNEQSCSFYDSLLAAEARSRLSRRHQIHYLHDTKRNLPDQVMEGDQRWVMQRVLSRASFRRPPVSAPESFTKLSLHKQSTPTQRSITKKLILTIRAIMIGQQIHLVAGDFNGTAWRCGNRDNISTIDEACADYSLPTPLWVP